MPHTPESQYVLYYIFRRLPEGVLTLLFPMPYPRSAQDTLPCPPRSFRASLRRGHETSFEGSYELSFQRSFDASFRLSFEASDERSDALSFEMSDARSDEASFEVSYGMSDEVSSRVCFPRYFPANSVTSFPASFQGSFREALTGARSTRVTGLQTAVCSGGGRTGRSWRFYRGFPCRFFGKQPNVAGSEAAVYNDICVIGT